MAKISRFELNMLRPHKPVREVDHKNVIYLDFNWSECNLPDLAGHILDEVKAKFEFYRSHAMRHNELVYAQKHLTSSHVNPIWVLPEGFSQGDIDIRVSTDPDDGGKSFEAWFDVSECEQEFAKRMELYERRVILYKEYLENNEAAVAKIEAAAAKEAAKNKKARIKALEASANRAKKEADKLRKELEK